MKNAIRLAWVLVLALSVGFMTSCGDDDDDDTDDVIVLDGLYIKGGATAYTDLNAKAMMKVTRNEVNQEERSSLYELYIPLKAGSGGFSIVKVAGATQTVYGPASDFADVAEADVTGDEPHGVTFKRGGVATTTTTFTVAADGFYHVVIDMELMKAVIVPVHWGMIGAATPGGWPTSTQMTESAFNATTMSWTISDMELQKADWKFRYSNGWKVILDADVDLGGGVVGVKVNSNFGGAIDALVPGGGNINNATAGVYTCTMTYTLGTGYAVTLTKTGDLPLNDYTNHNMGLVGDGVYNGANVHDWNTTIMKHLPTVSGTVYTWTYNDVKVNSAGSFKIRQNDDWNGFIIGYPQVTMAGDGAAEFGTNPDGNFVPSVNDAVYDFVFTVDASTETYTLTATKN